MGGPNYHPSLTDGSLDKPRQAPQSRPDVAAVKQRMGEMQQDDAPDAGQVLLTLDRTKKGEGPERLQIAVKEYEGHKYLDLRIWWRKHDGTWLPGKKGLTVRAKELGDVMRALGEAGRLLGAHQP